MGVPPDIMPLFQVKPMIEAVVTTKLFARPTGELGT
jgi:hypothetical protein